MVVCPSAATDTTLPKVEHYYGVEILRNADNGGGDNGYHAMIGDKELLNEMRFHNKIKVGAVKNAEVQNTLNQINWLKDVNGAASVLDGTDGCDIFQNFDTLYAIHGGTNATYKRFIVSDRPFSYDGDVAVKHTKHGQTPDYCTLLNNELRSIFNEGVAGTHAVGSLATSGDAGYGPNSTGYGFPRTSLTRFQYEQYARAKNDDTNSNLPYCLSCMEDVELINTLMTIEFRTHNLNGLLGHGISSNSTPTAEKWGQISGIRATCDGGSTYRYMTFGTSVYPGGGTSATNMWNFINSSCPLLKMFEAQIAVSKGDTLEAVTDADGNAVQGISQGVMTGIWTKKFTCTGQFAVTSGGTNETWTMEVCLRVPIWRGRNRLWGNLTQWTAGYDIIKYRTEAGAVHHDFYRAPSVEAIAIDSDNTAKDSDNGFAFVKAYDKMGEWEFTAQNQGGWATKMMLLNGIETGVPAALGGQLGTHENAYIYMSGLDTTPTEAGKYERRGVYFGGTAAGGAAVLRYAYCYNTPSTASTDFGAGFRVALN